MKHFLSRIVLLVIFLSSVSLAASPTLRVEIDGMTCPACAEKVEEQLSKLSWVQKVMINLDDARAEIVVKSGNSPNTEDVRKAVETAGYKVKGIMGK